MKYALIREDGVTEIREDSSVMPNNAIVLTDSQYNQLISGEYILQNSNIIINPNPKKAVLL
jgi:hypothetical protein